MTINLAHTLHTSFYTDDSFFSLCRENVFKKTWHLVADVEELPLTNSILPVNLLPGFIDEPILVTRDDKDQIHCFSNICTHRGAVLVEGACRKANIKCPYHGRRFGLDGQFQFTPGFKDAQNFPREEDNLHKYPFFIWGRFFFVSLNPNGEAQDFFKEMMERVGWIDLKALTINENYSREYLVKAHWALYCDNYLEGFHIPYVHDSLNKILDQDNYNTELFKYSNLQLGIARDNQRCFDLPESSPDYGKRVAAYYFWVFPNMMFNFYPWGLSINIVQPINKELTKVKYLVYTNETFTNSDMSLVDRVEREDEYVVESCQRGIKSMAYKTGRFSPSEELGTYHFQSIIKKFIGD